MLHFNLVLFFQCSTCTSIYQAFYEHTEFSQVSNFAKKCDLSYSQNSQKMMHAKKYQVLNMQVPVPVHEAQVPVPVPALQVPVQVQVPVLS